MKIARPATWYAQIVGQVLRRRRMQLGVHQTVLGPAVGLSASGWSRVEVGTTVLTVCHLVPAARLLGVSPSAIIQEADQASKWLTEMGVQVCDYRREVEPPLIAMAIEGVRRSLDQALTTLPF